MIRRFLITPCPKNWGGPGIFLKRIARELERRGYGWTAVSFHYAGISLLRWDCAFMMGTPRYLDTILKSGKPIITTMGKPDSREERTALGREYLPAYDRQELKMARAIMESDKVVFISDYVMDIWRNIFDSRGLPFPLENRTRVIHHGVDIELFSPPRERPPSPFVLGTVGALRERFRIASLFSVSRLMDFEHRILIVGSMTADCRDEFEKAMRDPQLARRTTYVPWVDAEELPDFYRRMHCLFHPVDYEGFGIVVAEALSCGVPVVVPSHGAPREYVTNDAGIVVKTRQFQYDNEFSENMAEAVHRIRDRQTDYSKEARKQAESALDIRKTMDCYLEFMGLPLLIAKN